MLLLKTKGFSDVKYNRNITKGLDMYIQHNWVYSIYSVVFTNASFVSFCSPFSLIPIESYVGVKDFNDCNKSKVKILSHNK